MPGWRAWCCGGKFLSSLFWAMQFLHHERQICHVKFSSLRPMTPAPLLLLRTSLGAARGDGFRGRGTRKTEIGSNKTGARVQPHVMTIDRNQPEYRVQSRDKPHHR